MAGEDLVAFGEVEDEGAGVMGCFCPWVCEVRKYSAQPYGLSMLTDSFAQSFWKLYKEVELSLPQKVS